MQSIYGSDDKNGDIKTRFTQWVLVEHITSDNRELKKPSSESLLLQLLEDTKLYIVKFECTGCCRILCEIRLEICNHNRCFLCKSECIDVCGRTRVDTLLYKHQLENKLMADYSGIGCTQVQFINRVRETPKND